VNIHSIYCLWCDTTFLPPLYTYRNRIHVDELQQVFFSKKTMSLFKQLVVVSVDVANETVIMPWWAEPPEAYSPVQSVDNYMPINLDIFVTTTDA